MIKSAAVGAAVGVFIWLNDYQFMLNAAGPEAPISRWLLAAIHLNSLEYPAVVLTPLLIFAVSGGIAGAIVGRTLGRQP
jgi:hypothetical protein